MDAETVTPPAALFQTIPVDQIRPSRHQARKDFDEEGIKQLAASIEKEDLLQPITVRLIKSPLPAGEGGGEGAIYELIAGERRLRAVKSLGRPTIQARVIEVVNEAAACAKGLVENLQRKDLNPIEEAEGFQELNRLDPEYWTQDKIGEVAGRDKGYISRSLALLGLPDTIKEKLRARNFSRSIGVELSRLTSPELQLKAVSHVEHGLKRDDIRLLVDKLLKKQSQGPGPQSTESESSALGPGNSSFKFTHKGKGSGVTISAFYPGTGSPDDFFAELRTAYMAWTAKAEYRSSNIEKDVPESNAPASISDIRSTPSIRLAETPEQEAELEQLATGSRSPVPVYAWVYGEDSIVTKSVAKATWDDFSPSDPLEFVKQFFKRNQ